MPDGMHLMQVQAAYIALVQLGIFPWASSSSHAQSTPNPETWAHHSLLCAAQPLKVSMHVAHKGSATPDFTTIAIIIALLLATPCNCSPLIARATTSPHSCIAAVTNARRSYLMSTRLVARCVWVRTRTVARGGQVTPPFRSPRPGGQRTRTPRSSRASRWGWGMGMGGGSGNNTLIRCCTNKLPSTRVRVKQVVTHKA